MYKRRDTTHDAPNRLRREPTARMCVRASHGCLCEHVFGPSVCKPSLEGDVTFFVLLGGSLSWTSSIEPQGTTPCRLASPTSHRTDDVHQLPGAAQGAAGAVRCRPYGGRGGGGYGRQARCQAGLTARAGEGTADAVEQTLAEPSSMERTCRRYLGVRRRSASGVSFSSSRHHGLETDDEHLVEMDEKVDLWAAGGDDCLLEGADIPEVLEEHTGIPEIQAALEVPVNEEILGSLDGRWVGRQCDSVTPPTAAGGGCEALHARLAAYGLFRAPPPGLA